jgi:hypothetical protein
LLEPEQAGRGSRLNPFEQEQDGSLFAMITCQIYLGVEDKSNRFKQDQDFLFEPNERLQRDQGQEQRMTDQDENTQARMCIS